MSYAWRASELALAPETVAHGAPFSLIGDRRAFEALEPEWNDLFRRAGRDAQLFQSFNWNWHWANHYLDCGHSARVSPSILAVRREGRLVMLWPLVRERVAGLVQL